MTKAGITILYDTREKTPWTGKELGPEFQFIKTTLTTGDYTIKGMEKHLRIERKASISELENNLSTKKNRERFNRAMKRLGEYPYRCLIITDDASTIYLRRYRSQMTADMMAKLLADVSINYGVPLFFISKDDRPTSKWFIRTIFKNYYNAYKTGTLFDYRKGEPSWVL
jgi:ERCC4-type nuclease